jgi:hypothetical protein
MPPSTEDRILTACRVSNPQALLLNTTYDLKAGVSRLTLSHVDTITPELLNFLQRTFGAKVTHDKYCYIELDPGFTQNRVCYQQILLFLCLILIIACLLGIVLDCHDTTFRPWCWAHTSTTSYLTDPL